MKDFHNYIKRFLPVYMVKLPAKILAFWYNTKVRGEMNSLLLTSSMTGVPIIKKSVHWFDWTNHWTSLYIIGTSFMEELKIEKTMPRCWSFMCQVNYLLIKELPTNFSRFVSWSFRRAVINLFMKPGVW